MRGFDLHVMLMIQIELIQASYEKRKDFITSCLTLFDRLDMLLSSVVIMHSCNFSLQCADSLTGNRSQ
jgi:hypothetical protein